MFWKYFIVFIAAFIPDVSPVFLPPAFAAIIFLRQKFNLNIWLVIVTGSVGSIIGRYILTLYSHKISGSDV